MPSVDTTAASPTKNIYKKRPREETETVPDHSEDEPQDSKHKGEGEPSGADKKKKQKQKLKQKQKQKRLKQSEKQIIEAGSTDAEKKDGVDEEIGKLDPSGLSELFAKQTRRYNKELTAVELGDLRIPEEAFKDTTSWPQTRVLANLPEFLKKTVSEGASSLSAAPEAHGSPHTLVITLAGLRAAEITRQLRSFQSKDCAVAKLFAKHIKLKDAENFIKNTRIGFGIGTPARIIDLANTGCLKFDHLKQIVVDGSYVDQKKRGIFDMKEIFSPLLDFLQRKDLRDRYTSTDTKKVEIIVF